MATRAIGLSARMKRVLLLASFVVLAFVVGFAGNYGLDKFRSRRLTAILTADELKSYNYATRRCFEKQTFPLGPGREYQVAIRSCPAVEDPQTGVPHKHEFALVSRSGLLGPRIVGVLAEEDGFGRIQPLEIDASPALLTATNPQGSGGFVDWTISSIRGGRLVVIKEPTGDAEFDRFLDSTPYGHLSHSSWQPSVRDGKIVITAGVYAQGDSNCCPSLGDIEVTLVPTPNSLLLESVRRSGITFASTKEAIDEIVKGAHGAEGCMAAVDALLRRPASDVEAKGFVASVMVMDTGFACGSKLDCTRGMALLEDAAAGHWPSRVLYATQFVDGNRCTDKNYPKAWQLLNSFHYAPSRDLESYIWATMRAEEREYVQSGFKASIKPSTQLHSRMTAPFMGGLVASNVLNDQIRQRGDRPEGDPVWIPENENGDMVLFQAAQCGQMTQHSDSKHCIQVYGARYPYKNGAGLTMFAKPMGPFYWASNLHEEGYGTVGLDVSLSPGQTVHARYRFNGTTLDDGSFY